jgi:hypothetical protein
VVKAVSAREKPDPSGTWIVRVLLGASMFEISIFGTSTTFLLEKKFYKFIVFIE